MRTWRAAWSIRSSPTRVMRVPRRRLAALQQRADPVT
jgi:hypothetical protein